MGSEELDRQRAVEDGNEDLIERLTEYNKDWRTRAGSAKEVAEAIAEIKRLRALSGPVTPADREPQL